MFDSEVRNSIAKIVKRLDVPLAALLAVADVESGGKVLAKVGKRREPLIRFEGHYFDRLLRGEMREDARGLKLSSPIPGRIKNPRRQSSRWELLNRAIVINRIAALSSCSWGLGQVMGSHWKWLGYGSVDALVLEARSGVDGQVALMARYIDRADLAVALRQLDWAKFARVYNGPSYRKNRYDEKMAAAYKRYSQELGPPQLPNLQDDRKGLMFGARGKQVKELQRQLSRIGYVLAADGFFGLVTDRVVRQFQRDHHLQENGIVGGAEQFILTDISVPLIKTAGKKLLPLGQNSQTKLKEFGSSINRRCKKFRNVVLSISRRFA